MVKNKNKDSISALQEQKIEAEITKINVDIKLALKRWYLEVIKTVMLIIGSIGTCITIYVKYFGGG